MVGENHGDHGEAEKGLRAQVHHVSNPIHLNFNRHRDLLFHFFSGMSRPLSDDLNPGGSDVGISFHRQAMERDDSPNKQGDPEAQHEPLFSKGKIDDALNHRYFSASTV